MHVFILLSSRCCWWARFFGWTLFDASKYSFGILIFCSHIQGVPSLLHMSVRHTRGQIRSAGVKKKPKLNSVKVGGQEYEAYGLRFVTVVVRVLIRVLQGTRRTVLVMDLQQLELPFCVFF